MEEMLLSKCKESTLFSDTATAIANADAFASGKSIVTRAAIAMIASVPWVSNEKGISGNFEANLVWSMVCMGMHEVVSQETLSVRHAVKLACTSYTLVTFLIDSSDDGSETTLTLKKDIEKILEQCNSILQGANSDGRRKEKDIFDANVVFSQKVIETIYQSLFPSRKIDGVRMDFSWGDKMDAHDFIKDVLQKYSKVKSGSSGVSETNTSRKARFSAEIFRRSDPVNGKTVDSELDGQSNPLIGSILLAASSKQLALSEEGPKDNREPASDASIPDTENDSQQASAAGQRRAGRTGLKKVNAKMI
jgi:hypothetical protein